MFPHPFACRRGRASAAYFWTQDTCLVSTSVAGLTELVSATKRRELRYGVEAR